MADDEVGTNVFLPGTYADRSDDNVVVSISPFAIVLDFHTVRRLFVYEYINEEADLLDIVRSLVEDGIQSVYPDDFLRVTLDAAFVDEVQISPIIYTTYRIDGEALFTDSSGFIEPSSTAIETIIMDSLDDGALLRNMHASSNTILHYATGASAFLGDGSKIEESPRRGAAIATVLFVIAFTAAMLLWINLYIRPKKV